MILVTGATGTVGRELVRLLARQDEAVRALTRDPAGADLPSGVEVMRGDYDDHASLLAATNPARAMFLVGLTPRHDLAAIAAARSAGVDHIVKLSVITADLPELGASHKSGEDALRASGLGWTILRPTTFASNTLAWAQAIRHGDPVPNPFADGAQGVVDPGDIAAVAAEALTKSEHHGQIYTLTGPETLTAHDQARVIGEVIGRDVRVRELSLDEWRIELEASTMDSEYVARVVAGTRFAREGRNAVVTDDVTRVTGRPAGRYRTWVENHRALFG